MNKKEIDKMIPAAYSVIEKKIASKEGVVDKTYRGGVSSFGAAVSMGSLISAAAFFSAESSGASYNRKAVGEIIVSTVTEGRSEQSLYEYVKANPDCKSKIMDAAVAVKLAMNLFELV